MLKLIGDRESHRSDRGEHGKVKREIGQHHHGRAGNGATRPDEFVAIGKPHAGAAMFDFLDRETAAGIEGLREFALQEDFQFRFVHHRLLHAAPDIRTDTPLRYNARQRRKGSSR